MRLRIVPVGHGARWIREGAVALMRFPLAFASIFATGLFALMLSGFIPYVGELLLLLVLPAGTLVFMIAGRMANAGQAPLPRAFVEVFRAPRVERIALLKLGAASAVAVLAMLFVAHLIDGGVLWRFLVELSNSQTQISGVAPARVSPRVQLSVLINMALLMLASIPFWHAPALIHWGGYGWAQSMFFSTVAFWRNKGAFAVYGFTWLALSMTFSLVLTAAAALLGPVIATFALVPMVLFGWTLFFTTRYFTFAACFEGDAEDGTPIRSR